jgi:uncharacterized protein YjdB
MPMPLVIPNNVQNNDFFIWITGKPLESVAFSNTPGASCQPGQTIRLTAKLTPLNVNIESPTDIVWGVGDVTKLQLAPGSETYTAAAGECSAEFSVLPGAALGAATINVSVTSARELGLKSPGISPRQVQEGITVSATYVLNIVAPLAPAPAALALGQPMQALQALPPEPQPFIRQYGYNPLPGEQLPLVSSSKILKLRSAAAVVAGSSLNLIPLLSPGNHELSGLVWSCTKPDIATVDGQGVVTGLKTGKAIVSVSVPGSKLKASCTVTVTASPKNPLSGISLNNSSLSLEAGKAHTLRASFSPANASLKGLSWISSNSAVATVDTTGKVSAISAGTATITAITDDGGHIANCAFTVTPQPVKVSGIKLDRTALTLQTGQQFQLTHTITPANATNQNVSWSSSNSNVVTVVGGQLTAIKKGSAVISVVTEDGKKKATCKVTVK